MSNEPTDMHGPTADAPKTTELYARCKVCGVTWQVQSDVNTDTMGCRFCNAPARAVTILSEAPGYGGTVVR